MAALVWFHRWLGVATCLLFALWFASGAVLLFVPFPSLPAADSLAMAAPLDMGAVGISPAQAAASAGRVSALRLRSREGRPAYLADVGAGIAVIDARTGAVVGPLTTTQAAAVVARATAMPVAAVVGPFAYDQWVVHDRFDPLRPFYRIDLSDPAGTRYYVSARTGEIVQRTTRWQRGWNWPGAVLHWAYLTPLRAHFAWWDRTVWWVSLIALLTATAGMVLGIWRTVQVRHAGVPGLSWFRRRWLRWHHLGGLFVGVFVLSWIFSGWLSMDHGRLFSRGRATDAQLAAYAGLSPAATAEAFQIDRLRALPPAREIRFVAIGGRPLAALADANGVVRLVTPNGNRLDRVGVDALIVAGIERGWPAAAPPSHLPVVVAPDSLAALAEGMPAGAERIEGEGDRPPIYIDGNDGRIVTVMSSSRLAYAWAYYALHSFNVPGLASHRLLRIVVVLALLAAGFLFNVTGLVLGWRRLRRGAPSAA